MTALLLAFAAIIIWSTLALLGIKLIGVPSFLLLSVALLISGSVSLIKLKAWRIPWKTLMVGVGGIFGYHFFYFNAFALAPAVEVNLINYLWPLFIVVFSPIVLRQYRLRWRHLLAAALGLIGAGLIVTGGSFSLQMEYLPGYLLAFGAAITWAFYSLLTKKLPPFGTDSVAVFCAVSGVLSLVFYFLFGGTWSVITDLAGTDWLYLVMIGVGPMGAAFFLWDAALKRGDPRKIGSLAYLTPLLSTLNLVWFGGKVVDAVMIAAMLLIVGGAVIGSGIIPVGDDT